MGTKNRRGVVVRSNNNNIVPLRDPLACTIVGLLLLLLLLLFFFFHNYFVLPFVLGLTVAQRFRRVNQGSWPPVETTVTGRIVSVKKNKESLKTTVHGDSLTKLNYFFKPRRRQNINNNTTIISERRA
jgi:hypothetical protein